MNPVSRFFQQTRNIERNERKNISVSAMMNSFSRLSIIQMQRNSVTFDDVLSCLNFSYGIEDGGISLSSAGNVINQNDLRIYAGMIYEAAVEPLLGEYGPILCLKKEMIGNDEEFLKSLVATMNKHGAVTVTTAGVTERSRHYLIDDFMNEANAYLKKDFFSLTVPSPFDSSSNYSGSDRNNNIGGSSHGLSSISVDYHKASMVSSSSPVAAGGRSFYDREKPWRETELESSSSLPFSRPPQIVYSTTPSTSTPTNYSSGSPVYSTKTTSVTGSSGQSGQSQKAVPGIGKSFISQVIPSSTTGGGAGGAGLNTIDLERNELMIRFLAHVRKAGMDILLPQIIHDKVNLLFSLFCVFISLFDLALDVNDYLCSNEIIHNVNSS
jgi:hypothetical protein